MMVEIEKNKEKVIEWRKQRNGGQTQEEAK
jgi:hypothetical protein